MKVTFRKGERGCRGWRLVLLRRMIHEAEQTVLQETSDAVLRGDPDSDDLQLRLFDSLSIESRWAVSNGRFLAILDVHNPEGKLLRTFQWITRDPHSKRGSMRG